MEVLNIIIRILKDVLVSMSVFLVFIKILGYKKFDGKAIIIILIVSLICAIADQLTKFIPNIVRIIAMYSILGITISRFIKKNVLYSIILNFISLTITYSIYLMSIIITGVTIKLLRLDIPKDSIIILFLIFIYEFIIIKIIFNIKRFKNGIPFLKNEEKVNNIGIIGVIFIGIVLIIYSIIPNTTHTRYIFVGLSIETICLFIWIKKKITKYYKQKLKEQTVADLQNEIKEKDNKINEILEENKAIATINHKYSSRIKALEEFSSKIVSKPELVEKMKTEFGEDYTAFAAQIKRISQEYSNEMKTKVTKENAIPKTGIFGIDTLLEHMSTEATKSNISLDVKINASLNYMVENIISESALETLLGDHIKDAIIAINCSNNTNRRILVVISIVDRCYEINFYDTGIEFEIDTLIKLGKEQITTHKETGRKRNRLYDHIWDIKQNKGKLNYRRKVPNE